MSANQLWEKSARAAEISFPPYPDGVPDETVYPVNNGARLYCFRQTSEAAFAAYGERLAADGFVRAREYRSAEHLCAAYLKGRDLLYLYYTPAERTTRLVTEPNAQLPEQPPLQTGRCVLHQLSLDQRTVDCGMSYLLKLCDGSFFLIDGGYFTPGEAERLYDYLCEQADGEIVIAGWFCTHAHEDHFGCFMNFVERYSDRVTIQALYYNFPSLYLPQAEHWNSCDVAATEQFYRTVNRYLPNLPQIKLHTGERFHVRNLSFEVLFTHEDLYPNEIWNFNDSSTVLRMQINGKTVLWLGDIGDDASDCLTAVYGDGDRLKCDFVQVAHHGFNGAKRAVYELADPVTVLWPTADYRFDENIPRPANTFLLKDSPNAREHLIAGYGTKSVVLGEPHNAK